MHFHTYFSDGSNKQQDSAVVHNHMSHLIDFLMNQEKGLDKGKTLYITSDGCGSQCRCGTAFYFLSSLAFKHDISIDWFVQGPGHGKGICDAIGAVTKNELITATARKNKSAAEARAETLLKLPKVKPKGKGR